MKLRGAWTITLFCAMAAPVTYADGGQNPSTALQACAVFAPDGASLEATVTTDEIFLAIQNASGKGTTAVLPISSLPAPDNQGHTPRGCSLVIDRAGDEAAIAVPLRSTAAGQTLMIARFDVRLTKWNNAFFLSPPTDLSYFGTSFLAGYMEATRKLFVIKSDGGSELYDENDQPIDGRTLPRGQSPHSTVTEVDTSNNRIWGSCPDIEGLFVHPTPCDLNSVTLTGMEERGPEIKSPLAIHRNGVDQWGVPYFFAYPSPSTVVFGGYSGKAFSGHSLWIANLADGSIRQMHLHNTFEDNAMTGRFAMTPDGTAIVFSVAMSKLGCCFVDNYISKGDRLLIVDLRSAKKITDMRPPKNQSPLGFALDHSNGKVVLVVNWGDGWERTEYPDHR